MRKAAGKYLKARRRVRDNPTDDRRHGAGFPYLHTIPGRYVLVAYALAVEEHATETELYGHADDVFRGQVVIVVVFLFAVPQEPAGRERIVLRMTRPKAKTPKRFGNDYSLFQISLVAERI